MKKSSFLFKKVKNVYDLYGENFENDDDEILNAIVKWTKNKKMLIYKHKIRAKDKNIKNKRWIQESDSYDCDKYYYIDVWHQ